MYSRASTSISECCHGPKCAYGKYAEHPKLMGMGLQNGFSVWKGLQLSRHSLYVVFSSHDSNFEDRLKSDDNNTLHVT